MHVLYKDAEGSVVVNPPDPLSFVEASRFKAAGVVLCGKDLVVGTAYIDHCSMMDLAGIRHCLYVLDEHDPDLAGEVTSLDPSAATLRGGTSGGKISFDVWHRGDPDRLPMLETRLQEVYDYIASHRKLRRFEEFALSIYDEDYVITHTYDAEGLKQELVGGCAP